MSIKAAVTELKARIKALDLKVGIIVLLSVMGGIALCFIVSIECHSAMNPIRNTYFLSTNF